MAPLQAHQPGRFPRPEAVYWGQKSTEHPEAMTEKALECLLKIVGMARRPCRLHPFVSNPC